MGKSWENPCAFRVEKRSIAVGLTKRLYVARSSPEAGSGAGGGG